MGSSSGLSKGAMAWDQRRFAVLVVALAGLFSWWRESGGGASAGAPLLAPPQAEAPVPENKYYYSGHPARQRTGRRWMDGGTDERVVEYSRP